MNKPMKPPIVVARESFEYELAKNFLAGKRTIGSELSLLDTLDKGLDLLAGLSTWPATMRAYCLRPLLQDDHIFEQNWKLVCRSGVQPRALVLAMEFRRTANAYLCVPHTDNWTTAHAKRQVGQLIPPVHKMLLAHKAVGYHNLIQHGSARHIRLQELHQYFENWFEILGVTKAQVLSWMK